MLIRNFSVVCILLFSFALLMSYLVNATQDTRSHSPETFINYPR